MTVWLLATLAAYRLWRLLALDDLPLLADWRQWLLDTYPGRYTDAIVCPWCLGFHCCWIVFALLAGSYTSPLLWAVHIAAASTVVGLIGSTLDG